MGRSPFVPVIVLALLLLACYYAYAAYAYSEMFILAHAPASVVASTGFSLGIRSFLLVVAAALYARFPDLRSFLRVLAALGGVYGLVLLIHGWNFPHSWYPFGGDLIAIDYWSMVLFIITAILAGADFLLTRLQRDRRLQAFRAD